MILIRASAARARPKPPWWFLALAGCSPEGASDAPRDPVVPPPREPATDGGGCPVSPLDWVDGIDEDGGGVVDEAAALTTAAQT